MSYDIRSIQRLFSATHRTHVVSCVALTARGGGKRGRHQRCVGCESSSGSAVEPGLEGGEKKGPGPALIRWHGGLSAASGRYDRGEQTTVGRTGNRVEVQRLAIMVVAASRSP